MSMPYLYLSRASFILAVLLILLFAARNTADVKEFFRRFFLSPSTPINLAIFRIVTCYYVFLRIKDTKLIHQVLSSPIEMRVPLPGYEKWFHLIPFDLSFALGARQLLILFTLMACVGLMARITLKLTLLLSLYVFLIPLILGKINHGHHHFIVFLTILAFSPCQHALSVDALIAALRRNKNDGSPVLSRRAVYTIPMCFAWLFFGIIYFFPGFWKLWQTGWYWAFSDNLINLMHVNWYTRDFLPFFRIDHYPWLVSAGAFITMLFEISAPLLVLTPLLRGLFLITGVAFHQSVEIFLGISFSTLYCFYFIFINWSKWLHLFGKKLYRREEPVYCVAADIYGLKLLRLYKAFDVFSLVEAVTCKDEVPEHHRQKTLIYSRATISNKETRNKLLRYTPFKLMLIPVIKCMCKQKIVTPNERAFEPSSLKSSRPLIFAFAFVVIGFLYCGFTKTDSWPFGIYPTFKSYNAQLNRVLIIEAHYDGGRLRTFSLRDLLGPLSLSHMRYYVRAVTLGKNKRIAEGLQKGLVKKFPRKLKHARFFRFYEIIKSLDPDRLEEAPVKRTLIFEIPAKNNKSDTD